MYRWEQMVLRATQEQNQIQEGRRRRKMNDQGLQSIANSLENYYSIDNRNLQLCNNNDAGILGQNNIMYYYSILYFFLSKIL